MTAGQPRTGSTEHGSDPGHDGSEKTLPSLTEQMAEQLGGWRGMVEASIPVLVFVVVNIIGELRPALIAALAVAVAIAGLRLAQGRPIRHAVNGLVGIAVGALIAWRTGNERDFYLPGIIYGYAYGAALLGSAVIRQPLVGWIWSIIAAGGRHEWRQNRRLVRTFTWLTVLWGVVWIIKVGVQHVLWVANLETALGAARLLLGYPPYALLLLITIWVVRRVHRQEVTVPAAVTG
jgi:hypothetical protein